MTVSTQELHQQAIKFSQEQLFKNSEMARKLATTAILDLIETLELASRALEIKYLEENGKIITDEGWDYFSKLMTEKNFFRDEKKKGNLIGFLGDVQIRIFQHLSENRPRD